MPIKYHFLEGRRPAWLALCCLAVCLWGSGQALAVEATASAGRGFKGEISRDMAERAALAEARLAAVRSALRDLSRQDEVRLLLSGEVLRAAPRPDPLALAWALLAEERAESAVNGVPPDMRVEVTLSVRLDSEGARSLAALLARPGLLDLYSRALQMQALALERYDAASAPLLRPGRPEKRAPGPSEELESSRAALEAAVTYLALLPELYPPDDALPPDGGRDFFPTVERLAGENPDNYLLRAELARLRLLRGEALQARELLDGVIGLRPDFAPAYDLRGLCLLWLELPALALADFSRAIRLEPYHPAFFENRALAHRILEDRTAMCADLTESCRLGECAGLDWAAGQGLCRR